MNTMIDQDSHKNECSPGYIKKKEKPDKEYIREDVEQEKKEKEDDHV